ncbi:MAG: hypothetical protein M0P13_00795 [Fibrobacteraceae bacterium]|nr:hypothetical protein [Fibrobacteraceae bacterium]
MRIAIQQKNDKYQFVFFRDPDVVCIARGIDELMIDDHVYSIENISYMKIYSHVLWDEKVQPLSPAQKRDIAENFLDSRV